MFQNRNCIDIKSSELEVVEDVQKNWKNELISNSFKYKLNEKGASEKFEIFICNSI